MFYLLLVASMMFPKSCKQIRPTAYRQFKLKEGRNTLFGHSLGLRIAKSPMRRLHTEARACAVFLKRANVTHRKAKSAKLIELGFERKEYRTDKNSLSTDRSID